MSELGLDEQESDRRPCLWVTRQWTRTPEPHTQSSTGKSGEAQGDHARLNLGGLSVCPAIGLPGGQLLEMGWEKSAEAIVVGVHRLRQALLGIELTHQQRAESFDARSSFVIS